MILPIYIYGQPVLRKVADDITPDYPQLKDLISDMWETLADSEGIGLAAPQIGKAIRLSVNMATAGDTVLIAGKGHEDYQIFADKTIHFDDCEQARNAVIEREGNI